VVSIEKMEKKTKIEGRNWLSHHISAAHCPVVLKFDMPVQYGCPEAVKFSKSASGEIQDGGLHSDCTYMFLDKEVSIKL